MGEWEHGLCGCFDDCGTCLLTYFVPCYLIGKDAEAVGDSCFLCGLATLFAGPCIIAYVRSKVRDRRNISGNIFEDFLCAMCCGCCIVAQMHQEVVSMGGSSMAIERE